MRKSMVTVLTLEHETGLEHVPDNARASRMEGDRLNHIALVAVFSITRASENSTATAVEFVHCINCF